jgi:hypothetical protein
MKTPEEMAEEYANSITRESTRFIRQDVSFAFFSGYQAAQEKYKARIKELEQAIIKSVDAMAGVQYDDKNT